MEDIDCPPCSCDGHMAAGSNYCTRCDEPACMDCAARCGECEMWICHDCMSNDYFDEDDESRLSQYSTCPDCHSIAVLGPIQGVIFCNDCGEEEQTESVWWHCCGDIICDVCHCSNCNAPEIPEDESPLFEEYREDPSEYELSSLLNLFRKIEYEEEEEDRHAKNLEADVLITDSRKRIIFPNKKIPVRDAVSIFSFALNPLSSRYEVVPEFNKRYQWIKQFLDNPRKYNTRLTSILDNYKKKGRRKKNISYCRNINCNYLVSGDADFWHHPYLYTKEEMMRFYDWDGNSKIVIPHLPIYRNDDAKEIVCNHCWRGESGTYYDLTINGFTKRVPTFQRCENPDYYKLQMKGEK